MSDASRTVLVFDYRTSDSEHRPYTNVLHDPKTPEMSLSASRVLEALIVRCGATDGDEIEITVRRTGERPCEGMGMLLVKPHTYALVPLAGGEE